MSPSALSESAAASAAELKEEWQALGFQEGPPLHISTEALSINRRLALALRCVCGARHGLPRLPSRREYAALAACEHCCHAEEI